MKSRIKIASACLLLVVSVTCGAAYALQSPECSLWVKQQVVQVKKKIHHSQATLDAWADWKKTHKLSKKAALKKFDLACGIMPIEVQGSSLDTLVATPEIVILDLPAMEVAEPVEVTSLAPAAETYNLPDNNFAVGTTPIQLPSTPEPSSLILLGTGLVWMGLRVKYLRGSRS